MTKPDHPSGPRVQVGLRLPPAHHERLKLIADVKGRSVSDIVAKMIERAEWSDGEASWPALEPLEPLQDRPLRPSGSGRWVPGYWEPTPVDEDA